MTTKPPQPAECFCGTELEAGVCPNGHDPAPQPDTDFPVATWTPVSSEAATTPFADEHPEDSCKKCGRPNIVWFAPNDLWNRYVRDQGEPGILCPVCFVKLAEQGGLITTWSVAPDVINKRSRHR